MAQRLGADAITRMLVDLEQADLGDPRRVHRAQQLVERLARAPRESLPTAMVTDAELEGAYRFLGNERVTFTSLLDPHVCGTVARAKGIELTLAIHDTTTCQFAHADPEEVGYLPTGKAGLLLHTSLLVDPTDWPRPLGLVHVEPLSRAQRSRKRNRKKNRNNVSGVEMRKWEDKEYQRWFRGVIETEERLASVAPVLHIADSESDSYVLMADMIEQDYRFIFRARHDRIVLDDESTVSLRHALERADVVLERKVPLSRRIAKSAPRANAAHPPRDARVAQLRIATTCVDLRRPRGLPDHPKRLRVHVVHVFEPDPPKGEEAVDWMLYTTEPVDSVSQLEAVVDFYRCRWLTEELNKALKTGCVVQERQLESRIAILNLLALSLPIAVELLALRSLSRQAPARPASDLLSTQQLAALRALSHRPLPSRPTAQDALWCIAGVGGHIKNNGAPGWQVLQRGMEKFLAFAEGWCAREANL